MSVEIYRLEDHFKHIFDNLMVLDKKIACIGK